MANGVAPDQILHSVASDLGLRWSDLSVCLDTLDEYGNHYENKPILIYWKFDHQKIKKKKIKKKSDKNSDIFHIYAQNIDCGYLLELLQQGGSNEYPQSMFLSRNKKKMYTPVLLYKSGV